MILYRNVVTDNRGYVMCYATFIFIIILRSRGHFSKYASMDGCVECFLYFLPISLPRNRQSLIVLPVHRRRAVSRVRSLKGKFKVTGVGLRLFMILTKVKLI